MRERRAPYRPLRLLGQGGMGEVWVAQPERAPEGEVVALKRTHPHLARQPKVVAQFEREARIGARVNHENIVQVLDFGRDRQGPFLALEWVEGVTASALLDAQVEKGATLPLAVALSICRDISAGISHAHEARDARGVPRSVLHRDVAPDNVLVSRRGVAKLADLGISKEVGGTDLTEVGRVKGKHGFLAPELYV